MNDQTDRQQAEKEIREEYCPHISDEQWENILDGMAAFSIKEMCAERASNISLRRENEELRDELEIKASVVKQRNDLIDQLRKELEIERETNKAYLDYDGEHIETHPVVIKLRKELDEALAGILRQGEAIKYIRGIVTRGEAKEPSVDEPIADGILRYVKKLEMENENLKAELCLRTKRAI